MKFPHDVEVDGYRVTVKTGSPYAVTLIIDDGEQIELVMYKGESKALRKALKAAEKPLIDPFSRVPSERSYDYDDEPLADWERELLGVDTGIDGLGNHYEEPIVGDITVSDLTGFLTLPWDVVLEDEDGDIWSHDCRGWKYPGAKEYHAPYEIFREFGNHRSEYGFVVTNPEVLN
jgi:hypothetical protein